MIPEPDRRVVAESNTPKSDTQPSGASDCALAVVDETKMSITAAVAADTATAARNRQPRQRTLPPECAPAAIRGPLWRLVPVNVSWSATTRPNTTQKRRFMLHTIIPCYSCRNSHASWTATSGSTGLRRPSSWNSTAPTCAPPPTMTCNELVMAVAAGCPER